MNSEPLPKLVRLDLNPDGSVTLLLTRSDQKPARLDFGVGTTEHRYRVTQLSATVPSDIENEIETLGFTLIDQKGMPWSIEVRSDNALGKLGQIHEHLKQRASTPAPTN